MLALKLSPLVCIFIVCFATACSAWTSRVEITPSPDCEDACAPRVEEHEGRCDVVVARLRESGSRTTDCTDRKHVSALGVVGAVLGGAVLLLIGVAESSIR